MHNHVPMPTCIHGRGARSMHGGDRTEIDEMRSPCMLTTRTYLVMTPVRRVASSIRWESSASSTCT